MLAWVRHRLTLIGHRESAFPVGGSCAWSGCDQMTLEALQAVLAAYLHQNGWSALPPIPYGYEGKTSTLWERPGYMPGWPRQTFFEAVTEQLALDLREDL